MSSFNSTNSSNNPSPHLSPSNFFVNSQSIVDRQEVIQSENKEWYKEAVFYEVYVRAFCDSNGDGIGDIPGLTSKLDYLYTLGVNCIWLLPIYPSPLRDDGYDVADYVNVHPHYGDLEDFKVLVRATHERNMRIIMDLIPNHTSDQHKWFQESRKSKDNPYRDYYIWSKTPDKYKEARVIFVDTEKSNWAYDPITGEYYWHRFYSSQPDLNFENPKVQEEMKNIMRFWLNIGIDGFRVDAVPYLFEQEGTSCENLPQTHRYLREMRKMIDTEYPGRLLLAEACQLPKDLIEYFGNGDEFHMGFHFPVMPRIYLSLKAQNSTKLKQILEETPSLPNGCQWVVFLRNHDELTLEMVNEEERQYMWKEYAPDPRMKLNLGIRRRLTPLLENDRRKIELLHSILLTLPGSPILYYGDEIGMGDNIWLFDRNGVRTPMQWDNTFPHGGFSDAETTFSPVIDDDEYGVHRVNVADAVKDPFSFYNILRHMVWLRRKHPALGKGKFFWVDFPEDTSVAIWIRASGPDRVLVVHNLSERSKKLKIKIPVHFLDQRPGTGVDIFNGTQIPFDPKTGVLQIPVDPYQSRWVNIGLLDTM